MPDPVILGKKLQALSTAETARQRLHQIRPLRGVRGVPIAALTRAVKEAWLEHPYKLPRDAELLQTLYTEAWEDGIVAVGVLAALVPDDPVNALELGMTWLEMCDDLETADALGWLVLGPALLAHPRGLQMGPLEEWLASPRPMERRVGAMAAMSFTTEPVTGPAAAALRERMEQTRLIYVEEPLSDALVQVADLLVRDHEPHVRKALARLLRCWAQGDPDAVEEWLQSVRGGVPKVLREEAERGIKRGRRAMAVEMPDGEE